MDNLETTETKKKNKTGILDIIVLVILVIILGFFIYLKVIDSELFLFGYVWYVNCILIFFQMVMFIYYFISWTGQPKSKKRTKCMIVCVVFFALEAGLLAWYSYEEINEKTDRERLVLSDGNEILLSERITHSIIGETRFEDTYMDVYQINGFAAKELGKIDETYFSNRCLSQDKYTYEYDEESKKLTIICEYGTYGDRYGHIRLKEEYDTGFWKQEFTLE